MSFWIELHCDYRRIGRDDRGTGHACLTLAGDNPGVMVTKATSAVGFSMLMGQAKANGWKRTAKGWACPHCRKTLW